MSFFYPFFFFQDKMKSQLRTLHKNLYTPSTSRKNIFHLHSKKIRFFVHFFYFNNTQIQFLLLSYSASFFMVQIFYLCIVFQRFCCLPSGILCWLLNSESVFRSVFKCTLSVTNHDRIVVRVWVCWKVMKNFYIPHNISAILCDTARPRFAMGTFHKDKCKYIFLYLFSIATVHKVKNEMRRHAVRSLWEALSKNVELCRYLSEY